MKIPIFEHTPSYPFAFLGLDYGFWTVHVDTLLYTWIAMALLFMTVWIGAWYLRRSPKSLFSYGLVCVMEFFVTLAKESFGFFEYKYVAFVCALFFFALACNLVGMLPFIEESTKDLNTTLAIALVSFLYIQYQKIAHVGVLKYIREYFQPIFLLLPLNLIDKMAKIISMAFRLFGNILGGSIVFFLLIYAIGLYKAYFLIGACFFLGAHFLAEKYLRASQWKYLRMGIDAGWMLLYCLAGTQMFFGIFEGVIQAFVIAMLTITHLSMVVPEKSGSDVSVS